MLSSRDHFSKFGNFDINKEGLYIVYDKFTFWDFFKSLRKIGLDPEQALQFIFNYCSLSMLVFEECIWNQKYKRI